MRCSGKVVVKKRIFQTSKLDGLVRGYKTRIFEKSE
jgi:hypothetical protein